MEFVLLRDDGDCPRNRAASLDLLKLSLGGSMQQQ